MARVRRPLVANFFLATGLLVALSGCSEKEPLTPEMASTVAPSVPAPKPSFVWETTGDESDTWETMTQTQPIFYEIVAVDQAPHPDDGLEAWKPRRCPDDQLIQRNAQLRMQHPQTGEDIDLEFRGPFEFMRHVSTSGSPYPTAVYKFHKDAYSYDKKYYAPKGNTVLLACDGNYIVDNSFVRFWSGYLFGNKILDAPK